MEPFLAASGSENYRNHISDEANEASQFVYTFPLSLFMSLCIKLGSFTGTVWLIVSISLLWKCQFYTLSYVQNPN